MDNRPPIGARPRKIHDHARVIELAAALHGYAPLIYGVEWTLDRMLDWAEELNFLLTAAVRRRDASDGE